MNFFADKVLAENHKQLFASNIVVMQLLLESGYYLGWLGSVPT